jgi:hypothetical protein
VKKVTDLFLQTKMMVMSILESVNGKIILRQQVTTLLSLKLSLGVKGLKPSILCVFAVRKRENKHKGKLTDLKTIE